MDRPRTRMLSWETVSSPLNVHLEHYEGPLDLLLDLIRRQQIDIKDIPIATITSQYLSYMEKARELDIDLGAEFVYLAADEDPGLQVTLFDLVKAFGEILDRVKNRPVYEVIGEDISVPDMILHLTSLLKRTADNEPLRILPLFERQRTVRAMISMFLAVLELVRRQAVSLVQTEAFGEIALKKHARFEEAVADEGAISEVEKDYK